MVIAERKRGRRFSLPLSMSILVAVVIGLERAFDRHADIVGLGLGELGQFGAELGQVQTGNLFIQVLG